jgi:dihydropteroate synthase-like protein
VAGGAELVLSVNASNREAAVDWGCEVVVIPDDIPTSHGLDQTVALLQDHEVPLRLDPILEPIGCGFAASLGRYLMMRQRYPETPIMMGVGNLTELTDCDSAAVNVMLLGICAELNINSVLTTQVIPWARTSVLECHYARQLVHYAVTRHTIPKHVEPNLVMLRDAERIQHDTKTLEELASAVRDANFRLFASDDALYVISRQLFLSDEDPFKLFESLMSQRPETIDVSHAFYLGYELAKASIARTLGKTYRQDEALDWGLLTEAENFHRLHLGRASATRKARRHHGEEHER